MIEWKEEEEMHKHLDIRQSRIIVDQEVYWSDADINNLKNKFNKSHTEMITLLRNKGRRG